MDVQRWPLGRYLGAWALLTAVQGGALVSGAPLGLVAALVVLAQLAKVPITRFRLADIGRDPSDAVFLTLVPIANFVGFSFCTERTPSETVHAARVARWHGKLGLVRALSAGAALMAKTAVVGLPASVAYGLVSGGGLVLGYRFVSALPSYDPALLARAGQAAAVIAVFLAAYTVLQYLKRATASRASWFPSVLLAPAACAAVLLNNYSELRGQLGLLIVILLILGWSLFWMSVGGAWLSIAALRAAHQVTEGEPLDAGACFREAFQRTPEVAGPVAAKVHAVQIGTQAAVLPGLFFALVLAFTEAVAVLEPTAASIKRAGDLSWGRRSRLFRLYVVRGLLTAALVTGMNVGLDGSDVAMASLFDPSAGSTLAIVISEVLWGISAWWLLLVFYVLYRERLGEIAQARAAAS